MAHLDLQTGTYAAAETLLNGRSSRRIGHNTTLHTVADGIAVRYHSTDIVTLSADGWLTMRTDGWDTVTTWQRINALLPGPWSVHSDHGSRMLYSGGRPITPYADGLQVHVGYSSGSANGSVGMNGATLLTAEDVAAIRDAYDAAAEARAEKRAARLLREHPTVNGPRTHTASLYERRARDCARCNEELRAEREARRAVVAAEHRAMEHALNRATDAAPWTDEEYAAAGSHVRTDYMGARQLACPWDCPDRPRSW
jgi:hypothetical protein